MAGEIAQPLLRHVLKRLAGCKLEHASVETYLQQPLTVLHGLTGSFVYTAFVYTASIQALSRVPHGPVLNSLDELK